MAIDQSHNYTHSNQAVMQARIWLVITAITVCSLPEAFAQPEIDVTFEKHFDANSPFNVAVDNQDRILYTNFADSGPAVYICDDLGNCSSFGVRGGTEVGQFMGAHGVAVDSNDRIIVADSGNDRIQICTDQGVCSAFGNSSMFSEPFDVAVDSQDRIIVADTFNNRIHVCNDEGSCTSFGGFNLPRGVAVDSQDRILVADTGNDRIQICNHQGACSAFGTEGSEPGQFNSPWGVAADSQGRIIVADKNNDRIQVCDDQGECVAFGSEGSELGQFNDVRGVATDSQDRIITADGGNERIQIFRTNGSAPFTINAGLNDAWYNPDTNGQGFFITVFPDLGIVTMAWFTYDTELPPMDATAHLGDPGHRWLTAVGAYADNQAVMNIDLTSNGIFDTPTDVQHTEPPGSDGTLILIFEDCNTGTVEYDIPSINRQGVVPIRRVADDNIALCQALKAD